MNKKDLSIIDIRKYTGSETEILDFEDGEIIFIKNNKVNNKYYYSMNNYIVETDTVEEIYNYEILESEFYSQHTYVIGQDIIIIKMNFRNRVEVDVLCKKSKKIKSKHCFKVNEEVTSIPIIINSRYFMFFTDVDEMYAKEYMRYKEKGYHNFLYLCDLIKDKIYIIKDLKIVNGISVVHGLLELLPIFLHKNKEYLIFNEVYMSDYEYEDVYDEIKENKLNKDLVTAIEALYVISVDDFVEAIKDGEENIPFKEIKRRYLNGWVRYIEMDEDNIYFREKDFETQIEKKYAVNKLNFESIVLCEIDHKEITGNLCYGDRIYEIIESDDYIRLRGIYNCDYNLCFKNDKNVFVEEFINDRYFITTQWIEDEEDNYFEFVYIIDAKDNNTTKYTGTCKIYNSCIIIYDS
ncbi:hypothetical protein FQB35_12785 [Crassaminicella thermophila]|uniref:Uncharacterized protein n=1 Tax=Crassaminicella thermophila TaxID=2599308 RepID=A0A5C0SER5_CRATE|nr:hypothetical protein [Crassaminicella thermophila]QEK13125.1 hypothetical protein FQB35_12785 [Crassaminicella thermophila]